PVIAGSHLDTQPTGGKFDGVYGVLAGLEVMRALNDHEIETDAPLEVVVWTNEEGSRFAPAMVGSGVWAGIYDLDFAYGRADKAGITQGEALARIGYRGDVPARARPLRAAFEAHIEQGPILERENKRIGIVSGVQGMGWFDVVIKGEACHAGPTPMEGRRDPFRAVAAILSQMYEMIAAEQPWGRVTFGDIRVEPGSRNTVPERVVLSVDMRHPDQERLDGLEAALRAVVAETCARHDLDYHVREEWRARAVEFDPGCVNAVKEAAEMLGYPAQEMFSGAGHNR
ncbi:MAG: Zn-dependent hydrolase, partial [Gammaproteobacteria bacterium]